MSSEEHKEVERRRVKPKYKSFKDMCDRIKQSLAHRAIAEKVLSNSPFPATIKYKPSNDEIIEVMMNKCNLAVSGGYEDAQLFIEDPDTLNMITSVSFVEKILANISGSFKNTGNIEVEVKISISKMQQAAREIYSILKHKSEIRQLVEIPSSYLITKNKYAIDLLHDNSIIDVDELRNKYDIVNNCNANYMNVDELNDDEKQRVAFYKTIISRVMQDWSDNDKEVEKLLWQLMYSVLQNDNHDKFFIIMGPGGNGKSTYMELLAMLSGEKYTVRVNIHQFGDANSINEINMQTRVIIGDDAATNHKISETALSNMKTLTTHNSLSVNVKFERNRVIRTKAPFIQGTNTDISFYENNPAIKSRAVVIPWTSQNFRESRDKTFNLDEMMKKQLFIDTLMMMCIEKVSYFEKYDIPAKVENATLSMIEANDVMKQYLDDVIVSINAFPRIPTKVLYDNFVDWCKSNNPSSGVMKLQTFTKKLKEKESDYPFRFDNTRTWFKSAKYKKSISHILKSDISQFNEVQYSITFDNPINNTEIETFANQEHPVEKVNDRIVQLIVAAIYDLNHTFIQSLYPDFA